MKAVNTSTESATLTQAMPVVQPANASSSDSLATSSTSSTDSHESRMPITEIVAECQRQTQSRQPVSFGLPFPRGGRFPRGRFLLLDSCGRSHPTQSVVLRPWNDGSPQWVLFDALLPPLAAGTTVFELAVAEGGAQEEGGSRVSIAESGDHIELSNGSLCVEAAREGSSLLRRLDFQGRRVSSGPGVELELLDRSGRSRLGRVDSARVETRGPVRSTVEVTGSFPSSQGCRFKLRASVFAETGLIRLDVSIHNPNRARHLGGLWDLGDRGSLLFQGLTLRVPFEAAGACRLRWRSEQGGLVREVPGELGRLEIRQASSGGRNWNSRNHVDRLGLVPLDFRGYRVAHPHGVESGLRASPTVSIATERFALGAAVPLFWQCFPQSIEVESEQLLFWLFPRQGEGRHELQGGERRTQTLWLFAGDRSTDPLEELTWAHHPAAVRATPGWYAKSGAIPRLNEAHESRQEPLGVVLEGALDSGTGLAARREVIDEYGWRNFGEVWADHEGEHYQGPAPVISHYNNQYDQVQGFLLQYLRTGDRRWRELYEPLARHVADIDIYHTVRDRAAYSGGLFWFTDHYLSAETCTHRTYSRFNQPKDGRPYGGGPSSNHLFSTGLLLAFYVTGEPDYRDSALELADWVIRMDDGRLTPLGWLDSGPTGLASVTATTDYHGPGRGSGNSVNTLLDGWVLSRDRRYLEKVESLIRRVIHPNDDIAALDLLNAEKRWSYPVFLAALVRYLELKAEAEQLDEAYAYARASLVAYGRWMAEHERPYFDRKEELEYPTEAWCGQELRKANVLRLAAGYVEEPERTAWIQRGEELSNRAWTDLMEFPSRASARAIALVVVEGAIDAALRSEEVEARPRGPERLEFGNPSRFVPQKERVRRKIHRLLGRG